MNGTTSRYCRVRGTCLRIVEELTAERDQLRAHLEAIANMIEPHWRGAGAKLESRWIIDAIAKHARMYDEQGDVLDQAAALLDDAWNPDAAEYDTQGVNQAHRVLRGGDPPRATKPHQVDEGAP